MNPYMVELITPHPVRTARWFRDVLRLEVTLDDEKTGFVLLERDGWRLALQEGCPASAGVNLVIQVANLQEARERLAALDVITSEIATVPAERYRKSVCNSPDGWLVTFFQWD
ncbi:MAG: VOC family protein [Gemmataceae bacterium]|nr:VOC family protein [Gemmataceae bacterium]